MTTVKANCHVFAIEMNSLDRFGPALSSEHTAPDRGLPVALAGRERGFRVSWPEGGRPRHRPADVPGQTVGLEVGPPGGGARGAGRRVATRQYVDAGCAA